MSWLDHHADIDQLIDFVQGMRLLNNLFSSKTDTLVQGYNDVFDKLLRDFRDGAAGDTLVVVHRIWKDLVPKVVDLRKPFSRYTLSHQPDI